jgi:hypothetical protein
MMTYTKYNRNNWNPCPEPIDVILNDLTLMSKAYPDKEIVDAN